MSRLGGRKGWALIAKLVLSAAVLALLFSRIGLPDFSERLSRLDWRYLAVGLACLVVAAIIEAERWRCVLGGMGVRLDPGWALATTYAAWFLGQFLPGSLSGDAAKIWLASRRGASFGTATASILIDRITGLIGMLALVVASLPRLAALSAPLVALAAVPVGVAFGIGLLIAFFADLPWLIRGLVRAVRVPRLEPVAAYAGLLQRNLRSGPALISSGLSVVIHLLGVAAIVVIAASMQIHLDFLDATGIVTLALLVSVIPISVNGWGLREGSMVAGLGLLHVDPQDALLISVLYGLTGLVGSTPGAAVWLLRKS